jgi:hypothetical protein
MAKTATTKPCLLALFLLLLSVCGGTPVLTRKVGYGSRKVSEGTDVYIVVLDAGTLHTTVHAFRFDENANLLKINGELEFTAKVAILSFCVCNQFIFHIGGQMADGIIGDPIVIKY